MIEYKNTKLYSLTAAQRWGDWGVKAKFPMTSNLFYLLYYYLLNNCLKQFIDNETTLNQISEYEPDATRFRLCM